MTTETMTIHKALCELKIIDDRIEKARKAMPFVTLAKSEDSVIGGVPRAEYETQIKAAYQSATDLIRRGNAIKRAVVLSNATTNVIINGVSYTVAEAIYMKNHGMTYYQDLLTTLTNQYNTAKAKASTQNGDKLAARADEYIKNIFGDSASKSPSDDIAAARALFVKSQSVSVVDPIDASSEIKKLENLISKFMVEIDSALSVSNATTEITVEY